MGQPSLLAANATTSLNDGWALAVLARGTSKLLDDSVNFENVGHITDGYFIIFVNLLDSILDTLHLLSQAQLLPLVLYLYFQWLGQYVNSRLPME